MDRDKAIAYELLSRELCPNCVTLREDWIDPETNLPHFPPILEAVARQCPGCDETQRVHATIPDKVRGAFVAIVPFDPEVEVSPQLAGSPPPDEVPVPL